jgi:hypothetical protein
MPLFKIAGNEIVEYEEDIEADTEEQAQNIFLRKFYDFVPVDSHSWQWHDTQEITDELMSELMAKKKWAEQRRMKLRR